MRNALLFLVLVGAAILTITVLLPILGVLFLLVVGLIVVGLGFFLAAPLLARLPWFRDRISVEQFGNRRSVRFGRRFGTSRPDGFGDAHPGSSGNRVQGDVIDVEGRELPDKEQDKDKDQDRDQDRH